MTHNKQHDPHSGAQHSHDDVIARELAWHEQEAHRRTALEFLYAPPAFDPVVQACLGFLAVQPGQRVLDVGCGEGKETLALGLAGARVVATDLSLVQMELAQRRLSAHRAPFAVAFVQANGEATPFADAAFDAVHGKAILHHLDLALAASEVNRLLTPGGRAAFAEPLAHHPLFWLARRLSPHMRTRDERPLALCELHAFAGRFAQADVDVLFLLAPLAYLFRLVPRCERLFRVAHRWLHALDRLVLRAVPFLRRFAWYGVVTVRKA